MLRRKCHLKSLTNNCNYITLPHDVEIFLGRSKETKIKNKYCSRRQVSITANCDDCTVKLKQLGENNSGLDGFAMIPNAVYTVGHGSKLEILLNKFSYIIEFDPPPDSIQQSNNSKRKLDSDTADLPKNKIVKMENISVAKETDEDTWENIDSGELYVFTSKGVKSSKRIAAFDMDGTLIKTKSGNVHPVDTNDWQIAFPEIPSKLKAQADKGFKVVILSNQAPIGKGRVKIEDFKKKIEKVVQKLQIPVQAFIATGKSIYRKPATGMWKILMEEKNGSLKLDMSESFYCGDAVGRLARWAPGKKKDHSMADRLLAENLGLKFFTPEQYFLGHSIANVPIGNPEFNPRDVTSEPFNKKLISEEKEILVLVGFPGSGKSFLAKQIENKSNQQYVAVCRDKLGSWQKCASEATKLLKQGKSIIVDSTNPDPESRARWTSLAREQTVPCRCATMSTTFAHAQHNNKFRELMKFNHLQVNDMIFYSYKNKFKDPTVAEGFKEVIKVKFNPLFEDAKAEELYRMFLLEK